MPITNVEYKDILFLRACLIHLLLGPLRESDRISQIQSLTELISKKTLPFLELTGFKRHPPLNDIHFSDFCSIADLYIGGLCLAEINFVGFWLSNIGSSKFRFLQVCLFL
ncbi:unnamed protein product [Lactuca saligna]|uniref:Uncharacterized protein n=1 Tax=Lactuca saligna TaxID=75948 RepID=A0AA35VJV0_LACSI|nr:unnamed protein product [Lactuca saligna]